MALELPEIGVAYRRFAVLLPCDVELPLQQPARFLPGVELAESIQASHELPNSQRIMGMGQDLT